MKEELYLKNLERNKKLILSANLNKNVIPIKKYDKEEFIITKDNISKIDENYLKKINFKNKRIIIDCSIFNVMLDKEIVLLEKNIHKSVDKIKFRNVYLELGNDLVEKCFDKIMIILNNYEIEYDKIYIFNYCASDNYFLNDIYYLITAFMISDKEKRYSYIYDVVCDELDRRFKELNLCDFKDNKCIRKRELIGRYEDSTLCYGCCYTKGRPCPYLKNSKCTIKSIGCKFFTCNRLREEGIVYRPNEFLLIKKFFNMIDVYIIENHIYTSKKDTLKLMLNN
jgi:hypothetical protein